MRVPVGLIILTIILSINPSCHAFYSYFTTTMDLIDYAQRIIGFFPEKKHEKEPSEIEKEFDRHSMSIKDFRNEVEGHLEEIEFLLKERLKNLEGHNSLIATQKYLQLAADKIGIKFKVLKNTQRDLNHGEPDFYDETVQKHTIADSYIEDLWSGITSTFLTVNVLSTLSQDFLTSKMVLENVCDAKVSRLQLLERLLIYFQGTSSEVFLSRHIIFNYFEKYHLVKHKDLASNKVHVQRREDFNNIFYEGYYNILNRFEEYLKNSPSNLWSCDPIKFNESNYLELKAFTKYYIRARDFRNAKFYNCINDCQEADKFIPQNILDDCMSKCSTNKFDTRLRYVTNTSGWESTLREYTRDCSKPLIDCKIKPLYSGGLYACYKEASKTEYKRYTAVQTDNNCIYTRTSFNITSDFTSAFPLECVCREQDYYVSTLHTKADKDHVIVGAQIQLSEDNILYIKVKQGKPISQGIDSLKWLDSPLNKSATQKIIWEHCDEFDLSEITLPNDRVIVGLGFTGCVGGRIHLRVISKTFNYKTGTLEDDLREEELIRGTKLYNLNNTLIPTHGKAKNIPIDLKKDGDYVKLALSSLEKDAGQTTVPFIDIQEVVPAKPTALSGASLVLRTQPGYGGFLGIQVFTYNALPHMPPHRNYTQSEIDDTLMKL